DSTQLYPAQPDGSDSAGRRETGINRQCLREERPGNSDRHGGRRERKKLFVVWKQHGATGTRQPGGGTEAMVAPASRKSGKYEILHKLGRGGMADVYLAQDAALGHNVALKLIEHAPDIDTQDSIAAERRGAVLQAHLAEVDPHVARIFDSGDADGFFY